MMNNRNIHDRKKYLKPFNSVQKELAQARLKNVSTK